VVEDKEALLSRHGAKVLRLELARPIAALPAALSAVGARLAADGTVVTFEASAGDAFGPLLAAVADAGLAVRDVETRRTTLEDVFVRLVSRDRGEARA
jgi:ABC-2 type transport system ATP-binding protein